VSSRFKAQFYLTESGNSNDGITQGTVLLDGAEPAIVANMVTSPVLVADLDAYSIQFSTPAGSTLVGTLTIEVSNDRSNREQTGAADPGTTVNWTPISMWDWGAGAQAANKAVASGANSFMLGDRVSGYRWARLRFAFTSGSGVPTVAMQQKGVS
jgi:hypothetical protein